MKQKKIYPAWPIYAAAAVWPVCACLLPLYTLWSILIALALSIAVFLIARSVCTVKLVEIREPEPPADTGNADADAVITRGREAVEKLKTLNDQIEDAYISREIARMEKAAKLIFDTIGQKPEKVGEIRKFMNYYLPTTIKLLEAYRDMDARQISGENIRGTMESVKNSMDKIAAAFEKQADALFSDEAMDISTDVEVLETMLKAEGLTERK